jgi:hypothetical protein
VVVVVVVVAAVEVAGEGVKALPMPGKEAQMGLVAGQAPTSRR